MHRALDLRLHILEVGWLVGWFVLLFSLKVVVLRFLGFVGFLFRFPLLGRRVLHHDGALGLTSLRQWLLHWFVERLRADRLLVNWGLEGGRVVLLVGWGFFEGGLDGAALVVVRVLWGRDVLRLFEPVLHCFWLPAPRPALLFSLVYDVRLLSNDAGLLSKDAGL